MASNNYNEILREARITTDIDELKKAINDSNLEISLAILTALFRFGRFKPGFFARAIDEKIIYTALMRINDLLTGPAND
ncbi:MAG: hypothetical protein Q4G69_05095 [Planctomycetia bacterium]|nr:hypothetical protein [Planctomycetia bacterium]